MLLKRKLAQSVWTLPLKRKLAKPVKTLNLPLKRKLVKPKSIKLKKLMNQNMKKLLSFYKKQLYLLKNSIKTT